MPKVENFDQFRRINNASLLRDMSKIVAHIATKKSSLYS